MEVRDISQAVEAAARTVSRQRAAPKSAGAENRPRQEPASDVVDISTRGKAVLESHGAPEPAANTAKERGGQDQPGDQEYGGALTRDVRRDYTVDNGGLVVKVIDQEEDKVIKEIPPEEQRRIREAVSRIAEENLEKHAQDGAPEEDVDVTS